MAKESIIEEFFDLIKEGNKFPKDELRDFYLVPAKAMLSTNTKIATEVFQDKTALYRIAEELIKINNNSIRQIHLNMLALDVIEHSPKDILNFQNKDGVSVVHLSTQIENFSVGLLDSIKDKGASFSLINKNGETPLILSASSSSLDDLKFIHAYTQPRLLNHKDFVSGSTALMRSVLSRRISNIFFLLESGASLFVRNNMGQTVLDVCSSKEYRNESDKGFYDELEEILQLFTLKQKAEETLKKMSG